MTAKIDINTKILHANFVLLSWNKVSALELREKFCKKKLP